MSNVITANFSGCQNTAWTDAAYQYDYGQVLQFDGLDLPDAYQVHFSNVPLTGTTITQIGGADGVTVPDQFFTTGETIYAWVYLHEGEDDGETVCMVTIPVKKRPQPSDDVPTPVEQSAIDQAIAALNIAVEKAEDAIEHYPTIIDGTWHVWDVTEEEYVDTGVQAQGHDGEDGVSPEITVQDITNGHRVTITDATGTTTFDVMDGENGADGISPDVSIQNITNGHRVTITDAGGTHTFDVMDGEPGEPGATGNGIASITKTGTSGLVDTYTITYTNGQTTTFTVTNGSDATVTVDDELSTTSTNPVQNKVITGELNNVKADLSELSDVVNGTQVLNPTTKTVSDFTTKNFYIGNDGKWNAGNNRGYFCNITSDIVKISITGRDTYGTQYAFLSSDICVAGQYADIVGGSTPTTVASGVTSVVDVPSGAYYLYIRNVNGDGYPMFPSSLIFYSYVGAEGLVDEVESIQDFLDNFAPDTVLYVSDFHVGTLYVSNSVLYEAPSAYRVCNGSATKIKLSRGDVIGLSNYSHYKYMLLYSADGATWSQGSWVTTSTIVVNDGYYCILIEDTTQTTQESASVLFNLLVCKGTSWMEQTEAQLSELRSNQTNPKFAHLSFDDVENCMVDLTSHANTYTSIFDNPFFAMLKELHDIYGVTVSLYLFTANIANYTTAFANDFAKNADWLKFGLHQGANNYETTTAATALSDYNAFTSKITAICGTVDVIDRCPRLGNFAGNLVSMLAMRDADAGIVGLLSAYDDRNSYYLDSADSAYVLKHGKLYDIENRITFYRTLKAMEAYAPESSLPVLKTLAGVNGSDYAIMMMHEYGVYDSNYTIVQEMQNRLVYACNWAVANGYVWDYPMNRIIKS